MYATLEIECNTAVIVGGAALWLYQTRSIDFVRYHYKHVTEANKDQATKILSLHFPSLPRN